MFCFRKRNFLFSNLTNTQTFFGEILQKFFFMFKKIIKFHENLTEISLLNIKGDILGKMKFFVSEKIPLENLNISFSNKYRFMLFDIPSFNLKFNGFEKQISDSLLKTMGFIC